MDRLPDWTYQEEWRDTAIVARCRLGFAFADLLDALAEALSWWRALDEALVARAAAIRENWAQEPW